ncbi:MAG TPA: PhnD/SsuA/transferrin family substrate-binding protein, partial [Campylobacterales bacterium]|nr:PhnD/SsuA/transferrin family substrate-binding protein [Campylobacterales bacterium]
MPLKLLLSAIFFCLYVTSIFASDEKHPLRFGVFAYLGFEQTKAKYQPIADYLNETLEDRSVSLEILSEEEMDKRISDGSLDIVTTNPTHFLSARKRWPLSGVIATLVDSVNGEPTHLLAGVIVTKKDRNDIEKLQHLKNKTVAIVGKVNLGGYRAQAYELKKIGINAEKETKAIIKTKTHQNCIKAVLTGQADVAFVKNGIIEKMVKNGELNISDIKVINKQTSKYFPNIHSTPLYPEWPVFALPHINEQTIRRLATALYAIEPDSKTAKEANIYGYTIPADYMSVEELTRELRLPPFDKAPSFTATDILVKYKFFFIFGFFAAIIILLLSIALFVVMKNKHKDALFNKMLLSSLGDGVYGVDKNGVCTFINDPALKMIGFEKKEVIGKNQHELFHYRHINGEFYEERECPIFKTTIDGVLRDTEDIFVNKNGEIFYAHIKVAPIITKGKTEGAVVVFQDITERKRLEANLTLLNENLQNMVIEETSRRVEKEKLLIRQSKMAMMGDMIAAIAHQWRQPLNALAILIQNAVMGYKYGEADEFYMDKFKDESLAVIRQMSNTIDDFRNFFKPGKSKEEFLIKS